MLAHLGEALDAFAVDNHNDREGVFADLLPAVLEAEASLGCSWRQVVAVLESFPSVVGHVSSDQVRLSVNALLRLHLSCEMSYVLSLLQLTSGVSHSRSSWSRL